MITASLDERNHLDMWGLDRNRLKQWLINNGGEDNCVLPAGSDDKRIVGCKVLQWQGHRVTLLCVVFGDNHVDVFVVNKSDLPGVPIGPTPHFRTEEGMTTAAWLHKDKIYFLAGNISKSDLKQLL
jgi:hypothetical protein